MTFATDAFSLAVGLLPVLLFLAALILLDNYRLVRRGALAGALIAGALAAAAAYLTNRFVMEAFQVETRTLHRVLAPVLEETLKALYLVHLVRTDRVGFLVDAGILGFAVGTGFGLVENIYYGHVLRDSGPMLWVVRGLGTAVMHGSCTAIVGIVAKALADRSDRKGLAVFLPGIGIAAAIHAAFNFMAFHPLLATAVLLFVTPLLVLVVFERSERATRDWLGTGLDHDLELLELIASGQVSDSPIGRYLQSLRARFPGPVVADMLCLLQVHHELAIRAKGVLIARRAGIELPLGEEVAAGFAEMRYLERSIGNLGRLAILPFLRTSRRDLWQLQVLQRRRIA